MHAHSPSHKSNPNQQQPKPKTDYECDAGLKTAAIATTTATTPKRTTINIKAWWRDSPSVVFALSKRLDDKPATATQLHAGQE